MSKPGMILILIMLVLVQVTSALAAERDQVGTTAGQDQGGVDPSKIDLGGFWYSVIAPDHEIHMKGTHPTYYVTGTDGHYEHTCTLTFDGTYYYGKCLDTPGKCCNNQGELWIKAVDGNSFKAKSRWWPKTELDKPEVTRDWLAAEAGWETLKRRETEFDPTDPDSGIGGAF